MLATWSEPEVLGAVLSNWAYASTYQIQWTNFTSWLVTVALVLTGLSLVWALLDLVVRRSGWLYTGFVLATFISGFVTALLLAKDAWAAMPSATDAMKAERFSRTI